jgi:hypothetical protein
VKQLKGKYYRIYVGDALAHKMHGSSQLLGSKLFAPGQAYVALSRVRSLNGLHLDEMDCGKLTNENIANTDALKEIEKLRTLAKLNESFKFCS